MKSSKQTLTESSMILIISTALVKIISAIFKIPLASDKILGEVGFGYFSVAHDLYMPFFVLAISGLPVAVSHIIAQKISENRKEDINNLFLSYKRLFLICGTISAVLLALLSVPMIFVSISSLNTAYSILAVVPSVFLCFLISAYRGYFEGFSNMYPTAVSKIVEAICKLMLGLILSYAVIKATNNPALAAAAAMSAVTIGTALATLYLYIKFKRHSDINKSALTDKNNLKSLNLKLFVKITAPFVLASLSASIVSLLDIFTVKMPIEIADNSYFEAVFAQNGEILGDVSTFLYGVKSKAFTIYNLIPTFTTALGVGFLPVLTGFWAKNDKDALSQNVNYSLKLVCTITFPAALGLMALSRGIMSLLYSSATALDGNLLAIYGFTAIFSGFAIPMTTVLQSIGCHKKAVINIIIGIIIKIVVSLSLVTLPKVNIYAAPIGTFVCYTYIAVSVIINLGKSINNIAYYNSIIKPLIAAVFCGAAAFAVSQISDTGALTVLGVFFGILVYLVLILVLKVYTKTELKSFPVINKLF